MTFTILQTTIHAFSCFALCLSPLAAAISFPSDLLEKPASWYRSEEGSKTTACVLSWQSEAGIWPKAKDTAHELNPESRAKIEGTFDNKATTNELRYLARAFRATHDKDCMAAFLRGIAGILKAQYPNGGWPQIYPPTEKSYTRRITFNDGSMERLLIFLREVATGNDYSFVDADLRNRALQAVDRGVDCIVKCQVVVNGTPTVWCAQHDEVTLAPAKARSYELPSLSGSESAGILRFLMSIEKPSPEVIRCVKAGAAWFESSKIAGLRIESVNGDRQMIEDSKAPPMWARFYDLETGRPFVCDRDGVKKHKLSEIGRERRNGYAWYGNWGDQVAKSFAKWPYR